MPDLGHFERLDLPRRFALDLAELDAAYLKRSRLLHPDRFAQGMPGELLVSQALTAALNESYKLLRDPFRRAELLVELHGGPTANDEKQIDPEFLEEMLDLRTRIEEAKADAAAREQFRRELTARNDDLIGRAGAILDSGSPDLRAARRLLNAAKYVGGLLRDLRDMA